MQLTEHEGISMVCMISKFSSSSSEFSNGCPSADSKDYNKKNASIMFILNIVCNKPDFKENLCKIIHFMFAFIIKFQRSTIGDLN